MPGRIRMDAVKRVVGCNGLVGSTQRYPFALREISQRTADASEILWRFLAKPRATQAPGKLGRKYIDRRHQHNLGVRSPPVEQVRQQIHPSSDIRGGIGVALTDVVGPKQDQDRTRIVRNDRDDLLSPFEIHRGGPTGTPLVQRLLP
jgi:hypothetical protein